MNANTWNSLLKGTQHLTSIMENARYRSQIYGEVEIMNWNIAMEK